MDVSVTPVTQPLSSAQTEIWLAQQLHPDSAVYNIAQYTVIEGVIDAAVFEAALRQVIDEADTLRLQFVDSDDGLRQKIGAPAWSMPVLDLTAQADPQAAAQAWMRADYEQAVNLMQGPLFCYALLKVAPAQWIWYQRYHHIMMDGYGQYLIAQRVAHVYSALWTGTAPAACDFGSIRQLWESDAQYQASAQREKDEAYWLKHCANWSEPATLANRAAPAFQQRLRQTTYLATQLVEDYVLDAGRLAQFLSAALAAYLHRMTGAQDVVFGFPVTARLGADWHIPGMVANTIPLRFRAEPEINLLSLMRQAAKEIQSGLQYQRYPSEALQRQLGLAPGQLLFGVKVNVMPFDYKLSFGEHSSTNHNLLAGPVDDLMLGVYWTPNSRQLRIDFDANPACYTEQALGVHQRRFIRFVQALAADAAQPIGGIDLLDADERHRLLVEWNATQRAYPAHQCIHQLFEAQVARTPQAPALVFEGQTLSYAQLNARANRLAHRLIELGVQPEMRVALCVERSPALVVGLLAILKAGGAYVPLDPAYPGERLAYILSDAAPVMVLADATGRAALGDAALASRTVLDPNALPDRADTNPWVPGLRTRALAYVIYTSGSTGTPKGVMVEHRSIVNLTRAQIGCFGIHAASRVLQFVSFSFDVSASDIFMALASGAALYLPPETARQDWQGLWKYLANYAITHASLPPVLLQNGKGLPTLSTPLTLILGGDAPSATLIRALSEQHTVFNAYGPTETTVCATNWCSSRDFSNEAVPIGRPIANTRIYLLDRYGQPVPLGAVGELYIGGAGVARGYLNRPELTAERFVPDPFSSKAGARLYKTGDVARYLSDGNLEFLGRNDNQVKIRGFRIEPGEIEACLTAHPQVHDAMVLAQGEGSGKRLVAYVVAEADESLASTLRAQAATSLPEYMVPSTFVRLDAWPLTPNGKLDRRALPKPDAQALAHQAYEAPQGELEMTLAAVWAELLGVERIGRHDSFFALGGHSLLAVQLRERLRRQGLSVSVRALFDRPTLSALAQSLGQHREVAVPPNAITPDTTTLTPQMLPLIDLTQADIDRIVEQVPQGVANIQDIYALSPLQDGMLFHHVLASEGDPYLVIVQLAFDSRERLDQYLNALQRVIDRHDILRTAFVWEDVSTPAQVVWRHARLSVTELTLDPADGPIAEQLVQRLDPRRYRVDLTQAPLLRCAVAQDTDGRWLLTQRLHHLIGDHSTLEVMHTEVQAFIEGRGDALLPAQPFRHLVAQARLGVSEAEHRRFFTELLAGVEPTLPFGLTDVHRDGRDVTESHRRLPPALNDQLRAHAKRLGVSVASLCHLAWAQVLARASGQPRVVFGTVLFGRMHAGEGADSAMGLFINTLPLCVELNGSVQACVRHTHARLAALLEHEHASLALAQRCSGVPAGTPLFSALLNYRHNAMDLGERSILPGVELLHAQERDNYPIGLSVEDFGQALGLTAQIVQPLDPDRLCGYMQQALQRLAETLEITSKQPIRQLEVLPSEERNLLLQTWNATQRDYPSHLCIHQLFEAQVERAPEAPALVFEDQTLSYTALNTSANRLAHRLIELGVKPDTRVAICVERSPVMVVGLLAILKAGGAYVPLDPAYPPERLAYMVSDSQPAVLLSIGTPPAAVTQNLGAGIPVLDLQANIAQWAQQNADNPNAYELSLDAQNLAYVIYTSGSTGQPKGVMVPHHSLVNLVTAMVRRLGLTAQDRMLQCSSLSFDASLGEMFVTLIQGATLVLRTDAWLAGAQSFWALCQANRVSVTDLPTQFWAQLVQEKLPLPESIRVVMISGDALSASARDAWFAGDGHRPRLLNVYGPTETTVTATVHEVTDHERSWRTIGRPIDNTRLYILDTHSQPVPLGAVGELYIGGAGVARGYLNRPELTAERFVRDPFSSEADARMYRTGDLVRYLPDGKLEFLGRNDHQVKIRGFRIELGEIEACLAQHAQVREAVVLAQGDGSGKRLVAYVVAEADESLASTLRAQVATSLPEYMVPSAFVRLDALPLTPNGKLDRRALPAPDDNALAHQAYEAPQGELETTLAAIWAELLGVERVGRHDSFFALGGHSLLAVRLMNRVAALGVPLPLAALFATPTLAALAAALNAQRASDSNALPTITPVSRAGYLPLSFAQQRLWFLAQLDGVSRTYHIPLMWRVQGPLDRAAWQQALNTLFARHEALRSTFVTVDGQPQVHLLPAHTGVPISWHDLRGVPDADAQLAQRCAEEAHAPFDLAHGPLLRACGIQLADEEHVMLLTQHHIVSDGWSIGVMVRELSTLYTASAAGQSDPLPPLAIQYPDYAAWQRQWLCGERLQRQSDYWRATLADAPVLLELPTDRPRPAQPSFAGAQVPIRIDAQTTGALKRLSRAHGTTLFMTVLAAWSAVLARLSGQDDVVIGTPSANRNHRQIEPLIGFFVNTLALRVNLEGEPTTSQLLERVRRTTLDAQAHQDLPFEQVVEIVQPPRRLNHTPLFQVMFAWQNNDPGQWRLPGLTVEPAELDYEVVKFDLELNLYEAGEEILGSLGYATALFDRATIERHVGYLQTMLRAMVAHSQQPAVTLELLSSAERQLLLDTWNATQQDYPSHRCIHQLFEAQVARTPQATALVYEDQTLSYAQLNARANRLAHRLIELGVQPDVRVALCVERSPALVVGLLAILKAGGAYVPLDPAYPGERLAYMLRDAAPALVLADAPGRAALGDAALSERTVLDPAALPALPDTNPSVVELTARHLAYVIYTSGSTGTPKGVMVPHHAIARLVINNGYVDIDTDDRVAFAANPAFDASTFEVWAPLLNGATVVVVDHDTVLMPTLLAQTLREQRISILWLTSGLFNQMAAELGAVFSQLKTLIVGGDVLDAQVVAQVLREAPPEQLINGYGPTESTTFATTYKITSVPEGNVGIPIGRPIANTRIYLLDRYGQPVPLGAVGELYIGGAGVARGYLNRPELTAERFVPDPFSSEADARLYKTGDVARYLPDGNLVFLGRNDEQVKIRGFRIERGEIEACLTAHLQVHEAVVLATGEGSGKRLVAYVVAEADESLASTLRAHVATSLPEYMVPSAFVRLDAFPLTPNGKLDRRALPEPDGQALAHQAYEAPQGELEMTLAAIWAELLGVERVGRHDSFFALGGHSLLAVQLMERLRRQGLSVSVRALFDTPVLSALAQQVGQHRDVAVPANAITPDTTAITPAMLPLIDLTQADIDRIVEQVPQGVANIQDIYALSPLQDGMLFHHVLASEGDPYLLIEQLAFDSRERLDQYLHALQRVIDRHDILRTAFVWEGLSTPAQVVWRHAWLPVTELTLDAADGPIAEQLAQRLDPRRYRVDLTQAPLLRCAVAQDSDGRWLLTQRLHHLISDHSTLEVMHTEVQTLLMGQGKTLPAAQPFRNFVAHVRLSANQASHERFFTDMLADVSEPTLPFGLADVYGNGDQITEAHWKLPQALNDRLRAQAKRLGVSLASLCHLAWAQVLARASGQQRVVFGTVLLGRMQAGNGADRALGLFLNVLPLRVDLDGSVESSVHATHTRLASLLEHEHTPLVRALRCSGTPAGSPLFSALLNYRHNTLSAEDSDALAGIQFLGGQERSNYPLALSVEDYGIALGLTVHIAQPGNPDRVCAYMQQVLESLVNALDCTPDQPVQQLKWLPDTEREQLLQTWNATQQVYPAHLCIHQLFEAQAVRTPDATALVQGTHVLSYAQLNAQANRLAHRLIELGVRPDARVAICVERSPAMMVGLLAILKAGGAYVPLDPAYPGERLAHILQDAAPEIVLADAVGCAALGDAALASRTVLNPNTVPEQRDTNPSVPELTAHHLAYVIYTSGSTGTPKGVMVEHRGVMNLVHAQIARFDVRATSRVLQFASLSFDASISEILMAFGSGATLYLPPETTRWEQRALWTYLASHAITHVTLPPALLQRGEALPTLSTPLTLILAGETPDPALVQYLSQYYTVFNAYGPTEATVCATVWRGGREMNSKVVPIGRPIANTRIYLLDAHRQLVPLGAVGELYIGGAGVARGYLNQPELTAECFVRDPFLSEADARMYRTGDLARYLPDGHLEYLGRNDHQVKVRGFRIELGEIEACLAKHAQVREAVVLATGEGSAQRLVAYVVAQADEQLANTLRTHVASALPEYMVPSAFVRLDAWPLTPNGKLDRCALPEPDADALAHHAYEAPQGELETTLAAIWAELLGVERVGRHDSFFALGGHSLLAMRLINRVRTALGVDLAIRTLFEAPTLAGLARHFVKRDGMQENSFSVLLPLKPTGSRPALFCIHPGLGLSWSYMGLSNYLHPDQPLYGLQARGLDGTSPLASTLDEMVSEYLEQMRRVQPKGPYCLLGWSLGGIVAHSMAVRLEHQGEKVALLALLDSYPFPGKAFEEKENQIDQAMVRDVFVRHYGNELVSAMDKHLLENTEEIAKNNWRIVRDYSPSQYGGDVLLFRATVAEAECETLISPDAWNPYVRGNIEVCNVHCSHGEMLKPESTALIAPILARKLNELENQQPQGQTNAVR